MAVDLSTRLQESVLEFSALIEVALLGLSQIHHRRRLNSNINEPVGASDSMLTRERRFHVFDTLTALDRSVVGIHANTSIFFAATDRGDEKASIIWCWFPAELVS